MNEYEIIQLSREQAVNAALAEHHVFMLDLDAFEKIKDLAYMPINEIIAFDNAHSVVYIEVYKTDGGDNEN